MVHKILFVVDNLEFGGGERGFLQLITGLDRKHFDICVASQPDGEFGEKLRKIETPLFPVSIKSKYNGFAVAELVRIINKEKINLVHSQGARADFFARMAVKISKRPCLVSTLQMPVDGFNVGILRRAFYQFFDHFLERAVDRFIVVSEDLKNFLTNTRKIPSEKIVKIYNGIEIDAYNPLLQTANNSQLKKTFGIDEETIIVGAIGRLCWQKGFEYFLRSIPQIVKDNKKVNFLLVGAGPLREQLENLSEYLEINRHVFFAGFRDDIRSILATIDLLVVPSIREGFPMIILEAMAMAKPIIASNLTGISEQLENGVTGRLIEPKDSEGISNAIIELIADKEKGKMMGKKARQLAIDNFSIKKMVNKVKYVYQDLLL